MSEKRCVCGREMEDFGAQTLEMNGSSLGSNLWTDHVDVQLYICPWCGRMAFFEPESVRVSRFRDACQEKTIDELRAIAGGEQPEPLQSAARERIAELEADARWKAEQEKEKLENRERRRKFFSGLLGRDDEDEDRPHKNQPPEF